MRPLILHAHTRPVTQIIYNREGDYLFSAGKDKVARIFDGRTGDKLGTYGEGNKDESHNGVIWGLDVSHDTKYLVTASADMMIGLWDVLNCTAYDLFLINGNVRSIEFCRKPGLQERVVICNNAFKAVPEQIAIYHIDYDKHQFHGKPALSITDYPTKCLKVNWGAFDATLISIHEDGYFRVWDSKTGELLKSIKAHDAGITNSSFNPSRTLMLTTGSDGKAHLWDLTTYERLYVYKTDRALNTGCIHPLIDSEDSEASSMKRNYILLAGGQKADEVTTSAGHGNFQTLIYNLPNEELLASMKGHFSPINSLVWIPDGSGFASGAEEGNIRICKFDNTYFDLE